MRRDLVECVPNFSEGRDGSIVHAIAGAITETPGALVLDVTQDPDHHRSVITFVAPRELVVSAAMAGARIAADRINLNRHQGIHPRIGAVDVLPFVPLRGVTLLDCVDLAKEAAARLWAELKVPSYLYEAAASRPDRINLAQVRKGQFEGLRTEVQHNAARAPDVGGPFLHPTAGATAVGARKLLIAFNINLDTSNVEVAKAIARNIRESNGGMPCVKALGVMLHSRNIAQVTMNLTDFEVTSIHAVWTAVNEQASRHGVPVLESELIGLMPRAALAGITPDELRLTGFNPSMILENRMLDAEAAISLK